MRLFRGRKPAAVAAIAGVLAALSAAAQSPPIADYIMRAWTDLTRSHKNLAAAAVDPKFPVGASGMGSAGDSGVRSPSGGIIRVRFGGLSVAGFSACPGSLRVFWGNPRGKPSFVSRVQSTELN